MSASPSTLAELLASLERQRGLRGRIRVIGRSLALLRRLSPEERERVALRVGSRVIWERLERGFLADGVLSPAEQIARDALEQLGSAQPGQLREFARRVRAGHVAELRDQALATIVGAIEDEAGSRDDARRESELRDALPAEDLPIGIVPFAPRATPTAAEDAAPDAVPAAPVSKSPAETTAAAPRPAADPPSEQAEHAARPSPARTPLRTLREISSAPDELRSLGSRERRARVADLGGGWASRRAISAMIRGRAIENLDEALSLVALLASPSARGWCLGDLLDAPIRSPDDVERILAAAPSGSVRRRLANRAARSDSSPRR